MQNYERTRNREIHTGPNPSPKATVAIRSDLTFLLSKVEAESVDSPRIESKTRNFETRKRIPKH